MKTQIKSSGDDADELVLKALASLNHISSSINQIGSDDVISNVNSLQLIVESAILVVPGSSAVIYTYDLKLGGFDAESRVSAEPEGFENPGLNNKSDDESVLRDFPRNDGIGVRTIARRKCVLSYEESDLDVHPNHISNGVKAVGCFPMVVTQQVVGVLYVYLREERSFSQLELLMLDNFVNQAAMAIFHTRRLENMRKDLLRKEDELDRLHRAGLLISSRLKLEETLESILQLALEMTNAHYGIFRLVDSTGDNLITRAFVGNDMTRPQLEILPIEMNSVMGKVARTRMPILIPDLLAEQWSEIYYPLDAGLKMRSELAVPLINARDRLEGVLNIESPEPGAFDENDSHMLQSLATYAITAIQEVRLLDALQEVARQIFSQPYNQTMVHLTEIACDLLNASSATIWLLNENELILEASNGTSQHGEKMPLVGSLTGEAIISKEAVISNDVQKDSRFYRHDLAQTQNWARALVVPLLVNNEIGVLGAFGVYSSTPNSGRFAESEWDKKVLTFLAHYAVLALQNENRQQELRAAQEQRSVAETFAAVGDIASNLLHHLNNKVGTIPVRVQSIQDKCYAAVSADHYLANNLSEIERCAMEAMQTVRENLSHLRPIVIEPVFISHNIINAIKNANIPAEITVTLSGLDDLPVVKAGGQSLIFVFINLLENAADAMQGKGFIFIQGKSGRNWVEIIVRDSGPGIHPELHDRIFELNYSSRSGSRPGKLGFGLWWVKTLMTRLGGSIFVESDGSHGTVFHLRLPRKEEKV